MRVMSGEPRAEAPRARPLSGGLWSLLSWLRREEHSSNESLSSVGSDRTTVSFAFLAPPPPRVRATGSPTSPLFPPTDSYRKRVHDRNIRKENDRDLTLRSKYGLFRADSYDAFSLPSARRIASDSNDKENRERRATSESLGRRAAYVPGKRRAPLPPTFITGNSVTRSRTRKRPAPKPPVNLDNKLKESEQEKSILMNSKPVQGDSLLNEITNGCKSEKYTKKENRCKNGKLKAEKSFLKQIFENKKRNSSIDPIPERKLPSISELDKQAAAIIESCKLKALEQNVGSSNAHKEIWFCTKCLRKYDSATGSCPACLFQKKKNVAQNSKNDDAPQPSDAFTQTTNLALPSSSNLFSIRASEISAEEKQKLKEMLKEMKDSLPKKTKHDNIDKIKPIKNKNLSDAKCKSTIGTESPTLRIGSIVQIKNEDTFYDKPSTSKQGNTVEIQVTTKESEEKSKLSNTKSSLNIVTQQVVAVAEQGQTFDTSSEEKDKTNNKKLNEQPFMDVVNIHTPLRISSLLNPIYIPKFGVADTQRNSSVTKSDSNTKKISISADQQTNSVLNQPLLSASKKQPIIKPQTQSPSDESKFKAIQEQQLNIKQSPTISDHQLTGPSQERKDVSSSRIGNTDDAGLASSANVKGNINKVRFTAEQYSKRRDLINQLEQSIAKGDEKAAAEAAMKLAQLRLSCSVLSFSSNIIRDPPLKAISTIVSDAPKSSSNETNKYSNKCLEPKVKVDAAVQSMEVVSSSSRNFKDNPTKTILNEMNTVQSNKVIQEKKTIQNCNKEKQTPTINLSTTQKITKDNAKKITTIQVWVEDREATRGPIQLSISRQAVMGELRREAEKTLGLASRLQRWIIGHSLCTNDTTPLVSLAGPELTSPFYLCVVEAEIPTITPASQDPPVSDTKRSGDVYSELVQLEQRAIILNSELFECGVCMEDIPAGRGAVLRDCIHTFCKECLSDVIRHSEEAVITCPAMGCPGILQEREIRALVTPHEYERWLAQGLAAAESGTRNAFHCRTRDCTGWAFCDPDVRKFPCPVCKHTNCIQCEAVHEGESCEEHRTKKENASSSGQSDGTLAFLDTLIAKGEALQCPECSAVIMKKWGCDWVKCSACKTEICWVTRGRRWGPAGRGDTSGGCRCGVDGKRCHPSCGYCH